MTNIDNSLDMAANTNLFFCLVLNRTQADLATARRDLRVIEKEFYLADPGPGGRVAMPDGQVFFPSNVGR